MAFDLWRGAGDGGRIRIALITWRGHSCPRLFSELSSRTNACNIVSLSEDHPSPGFRQPLPTLLSFRHSGEICFLENDDGSARYPLMVVPAASEWQRHFPDIVGSALGSYRQQFCRRLDRVAPCRARTQDPRPGPPDCRLPGGAGALGVRRISLAIKFSNSNFIVLKVSGREIVSQLPGHRTEKLAVGCMGSLPRGSNIRCSEKNLWGGNPICAPIS
jgi:hypothetical protein